MNICMSIENIILDYNYSIIDILNKERKFNNKISYNDFDNSGIDNIWYSDFISGKERVFRREYEREVINLLDASPLSINSLNKLIDEEHHLHLFSDFYDSEYMKLRLFDIGLNIEGITVYDNIIGLDKILKLVDVKSDIYIEYKPELIKLSTDYDLFVVVMDFIFNKNFKNRVRIDSLSK